MDDHPTALAVRAEYCALVLDTIRRYIADGHPLLIETAALDTAVRVSFAFDAGVYGEYFSHMGGEAAFDVPVRPAE